MRRQKYNDIFRHMSESALLSDPHRSSASARRSWTKLRDKIKEKDKGSHKLFAEV